MKLIAFEDLPERTILRELFFKGTHISTVNFDNFGMALYTCHKRFIEVVFNNSTLEHMGLFISQNPMNIDLYTDHIPVPGMGSGQ